MKAIVIPDDDLKLLEKRFGPAVRRMGSWNSDGVFSYSSVPMAAVEKAAESLDDPAAAEVFSRLQETPERTTTFIELLQSFGPALVDKIVVAYRECDRDQFVLHQGTPTDQKISFRPN
ncbi:MAG TPA: hypothetical protein VGZ73_25350 [Bryobacteraceae bacterium]|jgi:hypothetical protein|nr:hypothetical protein [Bryobacteraceae bacterium]